MKPALRAAMRRRALFAGASPRYLTCAAMRQRVAACSSIPSSKATVAMSSNSSNNKHTHRHFNTHSRAWESSAPEKAVADMLLYSPPIKEDEDTKDWVLAALCQNDTGVLRKITGVLASRGFNIRTIVGSPTEVPNLSRITIVLNGGKTAMRQAHRQIEDLVSVWAVIDYTHTQRIDRELILVKVSTLSDTASPPGMPVLPAHERSHYQRQAIVELTKLFQGHVVDISRKHVIIQLTAKPQRLDAFVTMLRPFGIIESARSGALAMARSPLSALDQLEQQQQQQQASQEEADDMILPPS